MIWGNDGIDGSTPKTSLQYNNEDDTGGDTQGNVAYKKEISDLEVFKIY